MPSVGRLAPTPSGVLHLGNALAFTAAWLATRAAGGDLLLRVEDVDRSRARREIEDGQRRDLAWLGLHWDREVAPQRDRDYRPALAKLRDRAYFCQCTRRDVQAVGGAHALHCRDAGHTSGAVRFALSNGTTSFTDRHFGARSIDALARFGDPVLRRRDGCFTYNLAVIADDIADGVTEVVRGADLLDFSAVQLALWSALDATAPTWLHSPLVLGPDGRKLSKSHGALGLQALRDAGWRAEDVHAVVLPWLGLPAELPLTDAIAAFRPGQGPLGAVRLREAPTTRGPLAWDLVPLDDLPTVEHG